MSDLFDALRIYQTTSDTVSALQAAGRPFSALFARMCSPDDPFLSGPAKWSAQHPDVTGADFDSVVMPATILAGMEELLQLHAPHLFASPLDEWVDAPASELFLIPEMANIRRRDDLYRLPTIDGLRSWLAPYRNPTRETPEANDCDDGANSVLGYAARCEGKKPSLGSMTISGKRNGSDYGHVVAFAVTVDRRIAITERDGTVCPLVNWCYTYGEWSWTGVQIHEGAI